MASSQHAGGPRSEAFVNLGEPTVYLVRQGATLQRALEGPGIFDGVTFIQRINTSGGLAPVGTNPVVGEVVRVPYTAEYLFYRGHP